MLRSGKRSRECRNFRKPKRASCLPNQVKKMSQPKPLQLTPRLTHSTNRELIKSLKLSRATQWMKTLTLPKTCSILLTIWKSNKSLVVCYLDYRYCLKDHLNFKRPCLINLYLSYSSFCSNILRMAILKQQTPSCLSLRPSCTLRMLRSETKLSLSYQTSEELLKRMKRRDY